MIEKHTLQSTAPIWGFGVVLYIHISELNTCELCFVMYQAVDYSHTDFAQYYYIDYVELVLHWVDVFVLCCSCLQTWQEPWVQLSLTFLTVHCNYVAGNFFVAS